MNRRDLDQRVDEHLARILVPARVQGDCHGRRVCPSVDGLAEVDTGGSHSFIAPAVAEALRLKRIGSLKVEGLGGDGRRAAKRAAVLTVAGVEVPVDVYDYPGLNTRDDAAIALLGRDFMRGGRGSTGLHLEYDGPSGRFALKPSRTRRKK